MQIQSKWNKMPARFLTYSQKQLIWWQLPHKTSARMWVDRIVDEIVDVRWKIRLQPESDPNYKKKKGAHVLNKCSFQFTVSLIKYCIIYTQYYITLWGSSLFKRLIQRATLSCRFNNDHTPDNTTSPSQFKEAGRRPLSIWEEERGRKTERERNRLKSWYMEHIFYFSSLHPGYCPSAWPLWQMTDDRWQILIYTHWYALMCQHNSHSCTHPYHI